MSLSCLGFLVSRGATFLSFMYTGMISYEKKYGDWIATFSVMKDLNILLKANFICIMNISDTIPKLCIYNLMLFFIS